MRNYRKSFLAKQEKDVVIIRVFPIMGWDLKPYWSEKADRWAFSIDFKWSCGPTSGSYTTIAGAIKAGERFLKKINPKLKPKKVIMYFDEPYIKFREYGSRKNKVVAKKIGAKKIKTKKIEAGIGKIHSAPKPTLEKTDFTMD